MSNIAIIEREGTPVTTSREVARVFEKRHDHILRDYDKLALDLADDFRAPNFGDSEYETKNGNITKKNREIWMTQAGFTLLAMGFTGKKALAFKVAYIQAFEAMRQALQQPQPPAIAVPKNYREAVQALLVEIDKGIALEREVSLLTPIADEFALVFGGDALWSMTQAVTKCQFNGVDASDLNNYFQHHGYIYKNGKKWVTTDLGIASKLFSYKEYPTKSKEISLTLLCLNNHGLDYIYKRQSEIEQFAQEQGEIARKARRR